MSRRGALRRLSVWGHLLHEVDLGSTDYLDDGAAVASTGPVADVDTATVLSSRLNPHAESALTTYGPLAVGSDFGGSIPDGGVHTIALDIDRAHVHVEPSSTPGHCHLYIDHAMPWTDYAKLLTVLGEVGLLESGYVAASLARKATYLRLPWVTKGSTGQSPANGQQQPDPWNDRHGGES